MLLEKVPSDWRLKFNCENYCHSFLSGKICPKWCFNEGHKPICLQFEVELDVQP